MIFNLRGKQTIRSRNARLTVLVPPEPPMILQGEQMATTAGLNVRLQCRSTGGKPPAEIEWYNGDRELIENRSETSVSILPDGKLSEVLSTLSLEVGARHHGANITCRAHNSALSAPQTAAIQLAVRFAPQVQLSGDTTAVLERRDVTLNCEATANPSQVTYQWFVNEEPQVGHTGSQLTLRAVGRDLNNATVRCRAANEVGAASDSKRITVLYAPRFRQEPQDVAADAGHEVSLSCDVDSNPEPRVTWVKRDCQSCQRRVGVGRRLRLRATRESVGRYECRAEVEGFPEVSRQLMLFVRAQPEVTAHSTQHGVEGRDSARGVCGRQRAAAPGHLVLPADARAARRGPLPGDSSSRRSEVSAVCWSSTEPQTATSACTTAPFTNAYGSDSAAIILQRQRALPLLIILIIVIGGIVVLTAVILVVIMCQRHHRRAKEKPTAEEVARDKLGRDSEPNSSGSDLKVEIRTTSSGSGHVITDRWDGAHEPPPSHEAPSPVTSGGGVAAYPCYDQHGYVRPPSGGLRAFYTSSPSTPAEYAPTTSALSDYGRYGGYGEYGAAAGQYVVDSQLKPGTLATHV
ncbi:Irregular chiasm C-roughest protein [Amphibalanus amphitrite]|uniref:Irregular chiasm C-roughest protein n=1 Tax=Amphibalanus amphitrite TaxID=1232801 RepID=A0A6A4VXY4_AMPAM|nr:Irregular chiasm C-roughest protein [Amphibalanus amphitrite]